MTCPTPTRLNIVFKPFGILAKIKNNLYYLFNKAVYGKGINNLSLGNHYSFFEDNSSFLLHQLHQVV